MGVVLWEMLLWELPWERVTNPWQARAGLWDRCPLFGQLIWPGCQRRAYLKPHQPMLPGRAAHSWPQNCTADSTRPLLSPGPTRR